MHARAGPARDHVREGRDTIWVGVSTAEGNKGQHTHEDPEARQCGRALQHAVEGEHHAEEKSCNVASCFSVWHCSDDHMGEGACEEHELHNEQQHERACLVVLILAEDGKVP